MLKLYAYSLPLVLLFVRIQHIYATHNRAGEIIIQPAPLEGEDCASTLRVEATIITYTNTLNTNIDRDSLTICWDDGVCEMVARSNGNGQGVSIGNNTKLNRYVAYHTYPARSTYVVSMTDRNRNAGILNVNPPNSQNVPFHIQTTFSFVNPLNQGCNRSPVLLQPPIDIGCVGKVFTHNPNAYDADNDSLSYDLITPLQGVGMNAINYIPPDMIGPNPSNNTLSINKITGEITWDAPQKAGEYNLAMIIVSYRNGQPLDTIVRDMQILIKECENLPPVVQTPFDEVCVVAGDVLEFDVVATAPLTDSGQKVQLIALGGPFEVESPATFTPSTTEFEEDPLEKTFRWQTTCEQISPQFYTVVFKATDDFFGDTIGLANLKTLRIKVVGPPPENVQAEAESNSIKVFWEQPYFCEDAKEEYFRGFTVWRKLGTANFPIDTCTPGLDGSGYTRLNNAPTKAMEDGRYVYEDFDVERGQTYCYRILGVFARTTPAGNNLYNQVESLASDSFCIQLNRDIPLITNVSVLTTDSNNGSMEVCWSKPVAEDLDTLQNPGPYTYELLRADGLTPPDGDFQPIGVSFTSPTFGEANDTCFVDTGLNTQGQPYSYKVNFYVEDGRFLGATKGASSVFLSSAPTDNTCILSWEENVPWNNFEYVVYRENAGGTFDSIATVSEPNYRDTDLLNGEEYCYYVKSIGSYGVEGVVFPIVNDSQEKCEVPVDNVPPCPPTLEVFNDCDKLVNCNNEEALRNTLQWVNPMDICEETDDVVTYNIYYAPFEGSDFTKIEEIGNSLTTEYLHKPEIGIAGCYAVTAVDTFANESEFSNLICVDNCPFYNLPNTFTPNNDGQNDFFQPFPYCFIDRVEFTVFNRWGQVVFTSSDPNLNWDGTNLTGRELAEGTYYYTCRYFERRVEGITPGGEILKGYIELIRGQRY